MGSYAEHVGPVCENARNAPERDAPLVSARTHGRSPPVRTDTRFNHQLRFDHIRRHEQPPQRAGPGESSEGAVIIRDWSLRALIDRSPSPAPL